MATYSTKYNLSNINSIPSNIKNCVYLIENVVTGRKYVGKTINKLKYRIKKHCGKVSKQYITKSIRKYKPINFTVTVLEVNLDNVELLKLEKYWIKELNTISPNGYNFTSGGDTPIISKESILKIKEARKNQIISEGTKKETSFRQKQFFKDNPEFAIRFQKASVLACTGAKQNIERVIERARNLTRGKVIVCSNGEEYLSYFEASLATGAEGTNIAKVCKGQRKSAKGFNFKYK